MLEIFGVLEFSEKGGTTQIGEGGFEMGSGS